MYMTGRDTWELWEKFFGVEHMDNPKGQDTRKFLEGLLRNNSLEDIIGEKQANFLRVVFREASEEKKQQQQSKEYWDDFFDGMSQKDIMEAWVEAGNIAQSRIGIKLDEKHGLQWGTHADRVKMSYNRYNNAIKQRGSDEER